MNTGNQKRSLWKMTEIAGMAVSIPFTILVGPFIGYFIGMYLKDKIGMHRYVMYTSVIIGVVVSIINTVLIIKMMLRISKERSGKGI